MQRKFSEPGDIEQALDSIEKSGALIRTRQLAEKFGSSALAAVLALPPSPAQSALVKLVQVVLDRDR